MLKKIFLILICICGLIFIKTIFIINGNDIKTIEYINKPKIGIINHVIDEKPIGKIIIKKISLKQYLYDINSELNNVDKNVTILNESIMPNIDNSIMYIAAHSGNDKVSFFNNLDRLDINDEVIIEYQNKLYYYQVINKYEIKKDGTIYGKRTNNKQLVLTTCCPNKDNCQLVINCIEKIDN